MNKLLQVCIQVFECVQTYSPWKAKSLCLPMNDWQINGQYMHRIPPLKALCPTWRTHIHSVMFHSCRAKRHLLITSNLVFSSCLGHFDLQSRGIDPAAPLMTERLCATPLSSDWAAQALRVKVKLLKGWSKSTLSDFQVLRSVLTHKTFVNEEKIRNHNKKETLEELRSC